MTVKSEQASDAHVKSVKKVILSCLRLIAALVVANSVLTFFDPLLKYDKFPPADILPIVDNVFIAKFENGVKVSCLKLRMY